MPNRETKTVFFTPEQASFVASCVDLGRFQSASEVVQAGLRLLQDEEERRSLELQQLRAAIQEGADQLDRGEVLDADDVFASWQQKHARLQEDTQRG